MKFETRHQGRRVEAFDTEAEARTWISDPRHGDGWTVTPEKPFRVSCRGSLVDTFDTQAEAEVFVKERSAIPRPFRTQRLPGRVKPPAENDWEIES
jgi:hypothetical protein